MNPDPDHPPTRGSAPAVRHDTVSLTKNPGEPGRPAHLGPPEHEASTAPDRAAGGLGSGHRTYRPWSARRLPAVLVASLCLVAAGAALFDVVAVRAGRPAAAWRRRLAEELAARPVDDGWMLTGAAVAVAAGLWLIVLALTPGLRRWLPLRTPASGLRALLDRDGAADLLRDAAMRVPGVGKARVRVRRHRVKARADIRFRDPRQVKDDLITALDDERDRLALARPPRIVVRARQRTD